MRSDRKESRVADVDVGFEKVLRLALGPKDQPSAAYQGGKEPQSDFSPLIDKVHKAGEAIRAANERALATEAHTKTVLQQATDEIRTARTRAQTAEARVQELEGVVLTLETRIDAAERRAREAEARAQNAEEWLARLHSAITETLTTGVEEAH